MIIHKHIVWYAKQQGKQLLESNMHNYVALMFTVCLYMLLSLLTSTNFLYWSYDFMLAYLYDLWFLCATDFSGLSSLMNVSSFLLFSPCALTYVIPIRNVLELTMPINLIVPSIFTFLLVFFLIVTWSHLVNTLSINEHWLLKLILGVPVAWAQSILIASLSSWRYCPRKNSTTVYVVIRSFLTIFLSVTLGAQAEAIVALGFIWGYWLQRNTRSDDALSVVCLWPKHKGKLRLATGLPVYRFYRTPLLDLFVIPSF